MQNHSFCQSAASQLKCKITRVKLKIDTMIFLGKRDKFFVMDKFLKCTWEKELGRKKYYIEEFNPTHNHQQKAYIGVNISWRSKILIAQLRTNSHQLRCETGCWKRPKEMWEERVCILCSSGKVETEKHFILECEAFKDSRENYAGILAASSWDNLFSE
jgi:hypothetical protein